MKIAICLAGIHYEYSRTRFIDYRKSLANYKKFIFDDLINNNNTVHIFISSYNSDIETELINDFQPHDIELTEFNPEDNSIVCILNHNMKLIDMVKKNEIKLDIKYDYIISSLRFDLVFFKKISEMNINYNAFNICMKHSSGNADGGFWIITRNYLDDYKLILKNFPITIHEGLHVINHTIINYNKSNNKNLDIHYMYTIDDTDYKNRTCNQYYLIVGSTQAFNEPIDIMIKALNTYKNMNLTLSYLNYNY